MCLSMFCVVFFLNVFFLYDGSIASSICDEFHILMDSTESGQSQQVNEIFRQNYHIMPFVRSLQPIHSIDYVIGDSVCVIRYFTVYLFFCVFFLVCKI